MDEEPKSATSEVEHQEVMQLPEDEIATIALIKIIAHLLKAVMKGKKIDASSVISIITDTLEKYRLPDDALEKGYETLASKISLIIGTEKVEEIEKLVEQLLPDK
ncbi:hypothetical protein ACFL3T_05315 [Patescibacteria group bacterium]